MAGAWKQKDQREIQRRIDAISQLFVWRFKSSTKVTKHKLEDKGGIPLPIKWTFNFRITTIH